MAIAHDQLLAAGDALPRPFDFCYWLLPGRVLAGEHPGARGSLMVMAKRMQLLDAMGIRRFIDLTAPADPMPHYVPSVGERMSFPITDFGLPDPATMRGALDAIAAAVAGDEGVYMHCRAGIGRTGTVAGCWLVEQGFEPEAALALLQRKFHAASQSQSGRPTPETAAQRAFVMGWRPASR